MKTGIFRIGPGAIHSGLHRSRFALRFIYSRKASLRLDGRMLQIEKPALVQFNEDSAYDLDIPEKSNASIQIGIAINHHDLVEMTSTICRDADELIDDPYLETKAPSLIPFERIISKEWEKIRSRAQFLLDSQATTNDGAVDMLSLDALTLLLANDSRPATNDLKKIKKSATRKELLYRLSKGKDYLENNFEGSGRVEQAASAACLSLYHFIKSFRELWGESPYKFVLRKQLRKSYILVQSNTMSLPDIAAQCGYTDYSAFSRKFHQQFGLSPRSLRIGLKH